MAAAYVQTRKTLIFQKETTRATMKKTLILLLCCSLLSGIGFSATNDAATDPLSWADCVSMAARNNPALKAAKSSLEAAKASYYGTYNGVMPSVSLSHSYSHTEDTGDSGGTGDSYRSSAQANWTLFDMQKINSIRISQSQFDQSEASFRQVSANLRYSLARAFNQLLYAQENIEVSKNIFAMREKEAQLVALRYDSGKEYKGNKQRAAAQFLQAKADLAQSTRELRTAQRSLNQQLGLDEFANVSVSNAFAVHEPGELPKDLSPLLEHRPDILLQQASVRIYELSLSQSKNSLWPTLSANYSLSGSAPEEFPGLHSGWGLALSYSLFGGGPTSVYYAAAAARNNLERSKQELRSARDQALTDIETAWAAFAGEVDQIKVQEALLEASRTRSAEADIRYNAGLMIYDSWEIIASDRINQEHQALQARLAAMNAEASWAKALGKQLEE